MQNTLPTALILLSVAFILYSVFRILSSILYTCKEHSTNQTFYAKQTQSQDGQYRQNKTDPLFCAGGKFNDDILYFTRGNLPPYKGVFDILTDYNAYNLNKSSFNNESINIWRRRGRTRPYKLFT
jgi:hypothetical protein